MERQTFALERIETPTGRMVVVADDDGVVRAIDWEDHAARMAMLLQRHYGVTVILEYEGAQPSPALQALDAYFAGDIAALDNLPTATNGSDFQRLVWGELRRIPAGETISYGTLADRIGRPTAARAVGLANGANPIAIAVPCHRVIGANAALTGYGGGLERKRWLLAHERAWLGARSPAGLHGLQTDVSNQKVLASWS